MSFSLGGGVGDILMHLHIDNHYNRPLSFLDITGRGG